MSLMINTEECTYVRAVNESPTAQDAVARWSPMTTPPKKVKRLNTASRSRPAHAAGAASEGRSGGVAVSAADMATVDAVDTMEVAEDAATTKDPAAGLRSYRVGYTTTLGSVS